MRPLAQACYPTFAPLHAPLTASVAPHNPGTFARALEFVWVIGRVAVTNFFQWRTSGLARTYWKQFILKTLFLVLLLDYLLFYY